jgi:tetratricopeptide (TPR) repeat protein
MKTHRLLSFLLLAFLAALSPAILMSQATEVHTELELGVLSYKAGEYEEAMQHFQRAVATDPKNINARLYLATAYGQVYIPGADVIDNIRRGELAIEQYQRVMEIDDRNLNAIKGAAYLELTMKKFQAAKKLYQTASEVDPNDPEAYYSVGVVDWTQTYQPRMVVRAKIGLKPEQGLIQHPECWQIRDRNKALVDEGIQVLKKAIDLRRDYDDAMAYMNLMYRERADIQCGDMKANAADLKAADDWVDMTLAIKKRKAEEDVRSPGSDRPRMDSSTAPNPQ